MLLPTATALADALIKVFEEEHKASGGANYFGDLFLPRATIDGSYDMDELAEKVLKALNPKEEVDAALAR